MTRPDGPEIVERRFRNRRVEKGAAVSTDELDRIGPIDCIGPERQNAQPNDREPTH
jgi:hypothetical protein